MNAGTPAIVRIRKMTALLICVLFAAAMLTPLAAYGQTSRRVVRVGWYESLFNKTDQYGRRSGYAYEYQRKIAAYTGWDFEYVEGSWPELMQMLIDGEIDLMSDVSYTPERAEIMLFSDLPMGAEEYFVYVSPQNESGVSAEDITSFNGKRFGVNKGSFQEALFQAWMEKNGIQAQTVEMTGNEDDSISMMEKGEIDAFVSIFAYEGYRGMIPICKIGASDFFFAVNKARPELLRELNFAMSRIQDENAYFKQGLQNKYLNHSGTNLFLSQSELDWLTAHGPIRVGYRDNYLAFCAQDESTGELTGALKDFLTLAAHSTENAEIEFVAVPVRSPADSLDLLMRGEVDCLFPTNVSDSDSEEIGLSLTVPLMQTGMVAVVRQSAQREFSLEGEVSAAVNEGNPDYETFLMDNFPHWNRIYFEDTEACLAAVAEGKADCLLVSDFRVNRLAAAMEKYRLTTVTTGEIVNFSFALRHEDTTLYAILNKVTNLVPSSSVNAALASYSYVAPTMTFSSFVRQNVVPVLTVICLAVAIILLLLLRSMRSEAKAKEAMLRIAGLNEEQKKQLEEISKLNTVLSDSQKNLREALEAAEHANRAKTSFLSNMSHEIRTPMNAIIGLDGIALRDPNISAETRDQLEKIGASARHLLALINDILDMSRIESGRMELKEKDFSLREFLDQINVIAGGQCDGKGLKYECRVIGTPDRHYIGDDLKLKQILINILGNSVKFTDSPGSVSFSVEELARPDERCALRFTITDTGIGMDKAFLSRLFDAFSQENDTSTNKYGGSGLGMAITKRMVDRMGGEILVESEKGVGSTFTVTVPLGRSLTEDAPAEPEEETPAEDAPLAGLHVLIAEDQDMNAEILTDILEMEDVSSEWAKNGQLAVELFSQNEANHFDAILMDMRMPVMDGLDATRAIRALDRPDAKTIPIIALTANAFEENVRQCLQAGMNAHLSKPIDIDALRATLGKLIAKQ